MLEVFDLSLKRVAILENSFDRIETENINTVCGFSFSLPDTDPKTRLCKPFFYVRFRGGPLYRILKPKRSKANIGVITYACEHVIATLLDDVLFGQHIVGNIGTYTRDAINYVLDRQHVKRWVIDDCEFSRQFEYGWENEKLLPALFSIANRFSEPYMWVCNTDTFPWRLSLKKINPGQRPQFFLRAGKNLLAAEESTDAQNVVTRLYCLGYGEGINQLNISEINGGLPYLQSPQEIVNEYGLISSIFVDRRFENAESLKERGQVLLNELQRPYLSRKFSVVDLEPLTGKDLDKAELGRIVELTEDKTRTYITGRTRNHDKPGSLTITLATKSQDIAGSVAELADRLRIEQVYSQGATQLFAQSVQANATRDMGAVLNFWLPEDMRIVNAVKAKITLDAFRSYSRATRGGGGSSRTSSDGGGGSTTSEAGGSFSLSTSGGGSVNTSLSAEAKTQSTSTKAAQAVSTPSGGGGTSANGGNAQFTTSIAQADTSWANNTVSSGLTGSSGGHVHNIPNHSHTVRFNWQHNHTLPAHTHSLTIPAHEHSVTIPAHSHAFQLSAHSHTVSGGSHSHSVRIPSHAHIVDIPDHTHEIEQGIFEFGNPTNASILINGAQKGSMGEDVEIDLTAWLLDSSGKIPRGQWMQVEVVPNDFAYVTIDLYVQGFVQSRGGATY